MNERSEQLFKKLMHAPDHYFQISELSQEFQVSERTIRNDLEEIQTFLSEKDLPFLRTKRGRGVQLLLGKKERVRAIAYLHHIRKGHYLSPQERFLQLIIRFSCRQSPIFLYQLEQELMISKSTLDADMRKLRLFLQKYGIEVKSHQKKGIYLEGNEKKIRAMIRAVILIHVPSLEFLEVKRKKSLSAQEQLVVDYLGQERIEFINRHSYREWLGKADGQGPIYAKHIVLILLIWLRRLEPVSGKEVSIYADRRAIKEEQTNFLILLCQFFKRRISVAEVTYITQLIESLHPQKVIDTADWTKAQLVAIQLIEHVEKRLKICFYERQTELHKGLVRHLAGLFKRVKNQVQIANPLTSMIEAEYHEIFQAVYSFNPVFNRFAGAFLTRDEIGFLTIYFSTALSQIKQAQKVGYRAIVICHHGTTTGKLLAENLKELFPVEILAILSSKERSLIEKLDIDVVFSTIDLRIKGVPCLRLSPILTVDDKYTIAHFFTKKRPKNRLVRRESEDTMLLKETINALEQNGSVISSEGYQAVLEVFEKHHLKLDKKEIQPMLEDLLIDDHIIFRESCDSWQEAIQTAAEPLLIGQVIESSYVRAMVDSVKEYGAYIVIGPHLALAHARPEDGVKRLGISVLVLSQGIEFGHEEHDPVRLVFCLAAIDAHAHLNVMKALIQIIHDREKIQRLSKATNPQQFKKILYKK